MRLLFAFSVIALLAVSCKKTVESDGLAIPVNSCNTVNVAGQNVQICFEELLEDSRCPANANCVWQGAAKGKFRITVNNNSATFNLSTLTLAPHYQNEVLALGYKFKLLMVHPYPGLGGGNISADVEITQ